MTGFLEFIDDRGGDWVLWKPEVAAREPELREAVDRFSFAMCSSHAKFSQRHRKRLFRRGRGG